jgi:hypothetical protein
MDPYPTQRRDRDPAPDVDASHGETHHADRTDDGGAEPNRRWRRTLVGVLVGLGGLVTLAILVVVVAIGALFLAFRGFDLDLGDPGDGRDSQRLAVEVSPATDLEDGSTVRVTSDAFDARRIVGVAVCLREADSARQGVDACDEVQGARYAVSADGRLDATYPVPRVVRIGGQPIDCAVSAGRCLLVAASADDYDRSGGVPISFRPNLPAAETDPPSTRAQTDQLPVIVAPAGPVAAGTQLDVAASGFQPGEPLLVAWCTTAFDDEGPTACEPRDASEAFGAVAFRDLSGELPTADAEGRFRTTIDARTTIEPVFSTDPSGAAERVDCRRDGCVLVIAAAADTKRSAVAAYELTPG